MEMSSAFRKGDKSDSTDIIFFGYGISSVAGVPQGTLPWEGLDDTKAFNSAFFLPRFAEDFPKLSSSSQGA